ncbi:AAA family ATPase [Candidatus Micrarchaeota archaeon]|nr:AAA family ATPase [Candidatus Micrarchaeota archaeon]
MITQVSLKNWRSHENTSLDFGEGTNILIGMMGGGKSSIIDAICYAFFGDFPAHRQKKLELSDIIFNNATEKEAGIQVKFISNGSEYTIIRRIKTNGNAEAEIRRGDKLIDGPQPKRVNEYIQNLLKVDYDLFTRAIYSEQNSIDYFLTLGRGDRKKQIDELLGINKFEKARANLTTIITTLRNTVREKELLLKGADIKKLEEEISKIHSELSKLEDEKTTLSKQISSSEEKILSLEKEVSTLLTKKTSFKNLEKEKAALEHRKESLKTLTKGISSSEDELKAKESQLNEIINSYSRLSSNFKTLDSQLLALNKELGTLNRKKEEIEKKLQEKQTLENEKRKIGKQLSNLQAEISSKNTLLDSLKSRIANNESHIKELKLLIEELNKEISSCPICETTLPEEKRKQLKEKREHEHQEELNSSKTLRENLEQEKKSLLELEKSLRNLERIENDLAKIGNVADDLNEISSKHSSLNTTLSRATSEKEEVQNSIKAMEKSEKELRDLLNNFKEFSELDKKLSALAISLEELKFSESDLDEKKTSLEKLRIEFSTLNANLAGTLKNKEKTTEILSLKEGQLKNYLDYGKEVQRIKQLTEKLLIFQNSIVETQRILREELIQAINEEMSTIWRVIYPYADYKGARLNADENDYTLELLSDAWRQVEGIASGGERACACLSLRIAFARVLVPNLSWLILDEPTHNLDEEAVKGLGKALYEDIPKIVDQTFVITHDENLKDVGNARIYRVERNKEQQEPSRVEPIY